RITIRSGPGRFMELASKLIMYISTVGRSPKLQGNSVEGLARPPLDCSPYGSEQQARCPLAHSQDGCATRARGARPSSSCSQALLVIKSSCSYRLASRKGWCCRYWARTAVNSSANSRLPLRSGNARPRSAVAMASSNRPDSAQAAANVRCKIGLTPPASFSARSANSTARIPLRSEALGVVASTHARLLCVFPSFASNAGGFPLLDGGARLMFLHQQDIKCVAGADVVRLVFDSRAPEKNRFVECSPFQTNRHFPISTRISRANFRRGARVHN